MSIQARDCRKLLARCIKWNQMLNEVPAIASVSVFNLSLGLNLSWQKENEKIFTLHLHKYTYNHDAET